VEISPAPHLRRVVARRLARLRRLRHLSQQEVGAALGVDRGTVSRWERGEIAVSLERLAQLSIVYDVPLASLLEPRPKTLAAGGRALP